MIAAADHRQRLPVSPDVRYPGGLERERHMTADPSAARNPAERPARLAIGVVGIGRVGAVLGAALRIAGHPVVAASGVSDSSRTRAEALLPDVPLLDPREVLAKADLALVTVPDDVLPGLVEGLAAT